MNPVIRPLSGDDLPAAAQLLALAMRDNPMHQAVFGRHADRRQQGLQHFFARVLPFIFSHGHLLGAFEQGQLIAVMGTLAPRRCRPHLLTRLRMAWQLLGHLPLATLWRLGQWLHTWRRLEPQEPHGHLGPLAVQTACQGQGLGTRLMHASLEWLEGQTHLAWLETDKPENVQLYEGLGFVLVREAKILGASNWLMQKEI